MTHPDDLHARLVALGSAERRRLARRIRGAARIRSDERRRAVLSELDVEVAAAEAALDRRRSTVPTPGPAAGLPIADRWAELREAVRDHQVVIVAGETGSGKSTQLPKLLLEVGCGVRGIVAHTQPRRIAARSLAERVAEELGTSMGSRPGDLVGYRVRFADEVGPDAMIKLLTDGMLLAEIQRDRRLERYDAIIVDEAHERSLNIDFLLGYLHQLLPRRPDLKLVITSATIDTEKFSRHFGGAPVVEVSGRSYPIDLRYRPLDAVPDDPLDQPQGICEAVQEVWSEGPGDILVFCSGEREIRDAADALTDLSLSGTEILPLYARLSSADQQRVFRPTQSRRIVLATNVAETSLTVPGIRYVVDPGTARISRYSNRTKVQRLPIEAVSQASADQRAGRCGRLGPGVCIRLYSEDDLATRPLFTEPEIQRTNLASVILQMAALGLGDVAEFPFVDPPDARNIRDGIALLEELGAVDPDHAGTSRWLTQLGRRIAQLPVDPRLARMIVEADSEGCLREVLVITAGLAIHDPRERPSGKEAAADELHRRFARDGSDLLSYLSLWDYLGEERRERSSNQFRKLCRQEYLNYLRVREWQDVHAQLAQVVRELDMTPNDTPAHPDAIHRAVLSGLLSHVGMLDGPRGDYRGARNARFAIAPGSVLHKRTPRWVMAAELVETSRLWAREVARIQPEWAERVGAHLVKRSHADPHWDEGRGAARCSERVTLYGLAIVTNRTVDLHRVDAELARRLFLEHALVGGEWHGRHPFVSHNADLLEEIRALEARTRNADLVVDDERLVELYDQRVPHDITTVARFDRWWKRARQDEPGLLEFSMDDLVDTGASPDPHDFPDTWTLGDITLRLDYELDPTELSDGVVVNLPIEVLNRLDPAPFTWHIPGYRRELATALARSLPKAIRRTLVPIPDTVAAALDRLDPTDGSLTDGLRRELARTAGLPISLDDFDHGRLAHHLRPTFRVIDRDGAPLAEGEDLRALQELLAPEVGEAISATMSTTGGADGVQRRGMRGWELDELPRRLTSTTAEGTTVTGYPALVDEGDALGVRVFGDPGEQADAMWAGTRRLVRLQVAMPTRAIDAELSTDARLALAISPYATDTELRTDLLDAAVDQVIAEAGGPPWDMPAADQLLERARRDLAQRAAALARQADELLVRHSALRVRLESLTAPMFVAAVADVHDQLDRLVYRGVFSSIGAERVPDLVRYLRAIERRLDKLTEHPARDLANLRRCRELERAYEALVDRLPWSVELEELGWTLEELRVRLFAEAIGAARPVSEQRIRAALDRLSEQR